MEDLEAKVAEKDDPVMGAVAAAGVAINFTLRFLAQAFPPSVSLSHVVGCFFSRIVKHYKTMGSRDSMTTESELPSSSLV